MRLFHPTRPTIGRRTACEETAHRTKVVPKTGYARFGYWVWLGRNGPDNSMPML